MSTLPESQPNQAESGVINFKQTDSIVITGKKGSGKSNLAKTITRGLINMRCPIKIIDPLLEYQSHFSKFGIESKYIDYGDVERFNNYVKNLYGNWKGILIIDEADGFMPNQKTLAPEVKRLIHIGRHYGIGMLSITRRLSNLHTDLISQTSKFFSFRLFAGADASYLERAQLSELIEPIWNLEKYQFVYYNAETGEITISDPIPIYIG